MHAKHAWLKEMHSTLTQCDAHNDDLRKLLRWEWTHSREWLGCSTDAAAALELTKPYHPRRVDDICNRFRRISAELGATVHWREAEQQADVPGHPLAALSLPAR